MEPLPPSKSKSSQSHRQLAGNLLEYSSSTSSSSPSLADGPAEAVVSHRFKITRILYQTAHFKYERPKNGFELYCSETRHSLRKMARNVDIDLNEAQVCKILLKLSTRSKN